VTEHGFGKRTELDEYREQNRGGQGIITIKTTERNGSVVGILQVSDDDEIMLITSGGKVLRTRADHVPMIGRNTQGVRLMDAAGGDRVVSIARLAESESVAGASGAGEGAETGEDEPAAPESGGPPQGESE